MALPDPSPSLVSQEATLLEIANILRKNFGVGRLMLKFLKKVAYRCNIS